MDILWFFTQPDLVQKGATFRSKHRELEPSLSSKSHRVLAVVLDDSESFWLVSHQIKILDILDLGHKVTDTPRATTGGNLGIYTAKNSIHTAV